MGVCYCRRERQLPGVCMLVAVLGAGLGGGEPGLSKGGQASMGFTGLSQWRDICSQP